MTEPKKKTYLVKTQTYWHILIFIGFLFTPVILYAISIAMFGDWAGEDISTYLFIAALVAGYICAEIFSKKLSRYSLRVQFDEEQITFEHLARDQQTLKKSISYPIHEIASFHDFNFGTDKTFKLKLNNGKTIAIYGKEGSARSGELNQLITEFKAFIETDNDVGVPRKTVKYENFYNSTWGKLALGLSWVALIAGVGLLIFFVFFEPSAFKWSSIKLPGILIFFSATYLAGFYFQDEEEVSK